MRILQRLLRAVNDPHLKPVPLRLSEELVGGQVGGEQVEGRAPRPKHRLRLFVVHDVGQREARHLAPHEQQRRLRQLVEQPFLFEPVVRQAELRRAARRNARVHVTAVLAADLRRHRRRDAGVAARLPLHGLVRDQPRIGARLSSDVHRRVDVHVDLLPLPSRVAVQQRGQNRHKGVVRARVPGLRSAPAHRRQRVVVVPVHPREAAVGRQRQVRVRLVGPR